jgi:hypothetical protein
MSRLAITAMLLLLLFVNPSYGKEKERPFPLEYKQEEWTDELNVRDMVFFNSVKDAILNNKKEWLADNIFFPLNVYPKLGKEGIKTRKQFLKHYDKIMNDYVRESVAQQTPEELFKNWQGIMVGDGSIWITGLGGTDSDTWKYYIITVNNAPIKQALKEWNEKNKAQKQKHKNSKRLMRDLKPDFSLTAGDKAFFSEVKKAILNDDKEWLMEHINLPLSICSVPDVEAVATKEKFLERYDEIFNAFVKESVEQQDPQNLLKNSVGLTIGNETLWMMNEEKSATPEKQQKHKIAVVTNVPLEQITEKHKQEMEQQKKKRKEMMIKSHVFINQ